MEGEALVDYSLTDEESGEDIGDLTREEVLGPWSPQADDPSFGDETLDFLLGPWSPNPTTFGDETLDELFGPLTAVDKFNDIPIQKLKRSHSVGSGGGRKAARADSATRGSSQPIGDDDDDEIDSFNPHDYFELVDLDEKQWRKGPVKEKASKIRLTRDIPSKNPILRMLLLNKVLEAAMQALIEQGNPDSTGQLVAHHSEFGQRGIPTCRKKLRDLTFMDLADQVLKVIQSDQSIRLEDIVFYLNTFHPTVGGETRRLQDRQMSRTKHFLTKTSLYNPTNDRHRGTSFYKGLCVPLIIAKELKFQEDEGSRSKLRDYLQSKEAIVKAKELVKQAGLDPAEGPFTLEQLPEFSKCLPPDVSLHFFDDEAPPFLSVKKPGNKSINIFLLYNEPGGREEGASYHAYGINNLSGFMGAMGKDQFCAGCYKIHFAQSAEGHKCEKAECKLCKKIECKNNSPKDPFKFIYCATCNLYFSSEGCKSAHICGDKVKCEWCGLIQNKKNQKHECGKAYCNTCQATHAPQKGCFVQAPKKPKKKMKRSVWYADAECQVGPDGEHIANLLILRKSDAPPGEYIEYSGTEAMDLFVKDCVETPMFAHSYVVFHNASGYDGHLWLKALDKADAHPKDIILKGQKLLSMTLSGNDIICRDSLLFIPGTPLSAFPRMFGLDCGNKGDFPHKLNTPEWVRFDGEPVVYEEKVKDRTERFPPLHYFGTEWKSRQELERLTKWWVEEYRRFENNPTLKYIPEDELVRYCRQDVDILLQGFEAYRNAAIKEHGSDPLESITFPQFNNMIFRGKFMAKDSIAVLPPQGYECSEEGHKSSLSALAYLSYVEKKEKLSGFRCGRKGGEVILNGHPVDGFGVDPAGMQQAYNYHGCWFHGHHPSECLNKRAAKRRWSKYPGLMTKRRELTRLTDAALQKVADAGKPYGPLRYNVKWACEVQAECKHNSRMKRYISQYKQRMTEPLRPRDAMRGGRTNAVKHIVDPVPLGYILAYLDFTSLYPGVNASVDGEEWPIGQPDIFVGKEVDRGPKPGEWFGMAKVGILPPRGLMHPVLAQLGKDKVLFHLCTSCASDAQEGPCLHSDKERMIKGTFCTVELDLAVSKGYKICHIDEIWHWPRERRSKDLFRPMILDLFRKKVLASSKPQDPTKLRQLIKDLASLGIVIKEEEWDPNAVLRALLKFCLNNIWGFLGKRSDVETTEFVKSLGRLMEIINDPEKEVKQVRVSPDEESLLVSTKPLKEHATPTQNIVLAALTTAYARIKLYKVLDRRPDQVIYFDTDSVVLLIPPGDTPPPTSTMLGGLKDEVEEEFGIGASITSFVAIAPKSYSYSVERDGKLLKEAFRLKGIKMTAEVADLVDADALRRLALGLTPPIRVPQHNIVKNVFKSSLKSRTLRKTVRFYSTKRYLLPEPNPFLDTRPYGY